MSKLIMPHCAFRRALAAALLAAVTAAGLPAVYWAQDQGRWVRKAGS